MIPITYNAADATFLRGYAKYETDSNKLSVSVPGTWNAFTAYIVFSVTPLAPSMNHWLLHTPLVASNFGNTNKVRNGRNAFYDLTIPNTGAHIIKIAKVLNGNLYGRIDELAGLNCAAAVASTSTMTIQLGLTSGYDTTSGTIKIAEVIFFKDASFVDGDANDVQALQYLRWYHFGDLPLPLMFNAGGPWLDNV